jgi:hypothetical protein
MSDADSTSRRRPPTIDLTAKEVATGSADPTPHPDAEAARPDGKPEAAEDTAADGATSASTASAGPADGSSSRRSRTVIGVAAGIVVAAAIAAALWFAGLVPMPHESAPQSAATPPRADAPAGASALPATPRAQAGAGDDISTRLDRIEQALQGPPHTDAALAGRVAGAEAQAKALGDSIAALTRRVDDLAATAKTALAEAKSAAAAADAAKEAAKNLVQPSSGVQRSDIDAVESRVAALQSAIKSLDASLAQRASLSRADDRAMRLAIAAEALRTAAERGAPFGAALAAVEALGADPKAVAALEPFAAHGLIGTAELGRELIALTPALDRAIEPAPSNTSLLGMLESRAQKLVRITPVGPSAAPAGDDSAAAIGRLNADAARGDIYAALAEIAKLPDEARAPAQAWADKAAARQAALAESRRIAAEALTALAKPESR